MNSSDLPGDPHVVWRSNDHAPSAPIHAPLRHTYYDAPVIVEQSTRSVTTRAIGAGELIAASKLSPTTVGRAKSENSAHTNRRVRKSVDTTLKICCLGFLVIRRGGTIPITIRPDSRPALLLRLLIASGPHGIEKQQAERILWPTSDAMPTQSLIDSTLYRLRQLLHSERACRMDRGRIFLDGNIVSIDSWLFEGEADALLSRLRRAAAAEAGEIAVRIERLSELYRGPFFALEESLPAIAQTRDRLQEKFVQAVARSGEFWQQEGRWDRAQQLYEQALTLDNLAEETHRQIIRCHLAQGHFAEAVRAFNRCRELLETVLGVAPSEETTRLYRHALTARDGGVKT